MSLIPNDACNAQILDSDNADDRSILEQLRADPQIQFIDRGEEQAANVRELLPSPAPDLIAETRKWAHYPWRRAVVQVLGPRAFRRVRLDRNRNMITASEQDRLGALRIGVIGLSAGHVIAYGLAAEGLCGELRLADFDHLELPNLNRVAATVLDLGLNKAMVASRRIAELDPYLPVEVFTSGITTESMDSFLNGLDIVVEECDSFDMKLVIREAARARRIPVLMATSDRGLMDVERYDVEPTRPILHGLLGDIDAAQLSGLTGKDKVAHGLRILGAAELSSRFAASLVEVGETLSTWPQLASEVSFGATAVAEAVRRIGLGTALPSGRVRIDVAAAFDRHEEPVKSTDDHQSTGDSSDSAGPTGHAGPAEIVASAAIRAPSGGNAQPWDLYVQDGQIVLRLATQYTSAMDIGFRGSAVALGAAVFNARVAAAAYGCLGSVEIDECDERSPLQAVIQLGRAGNPSLAEMYGPMLRRETNRHYGTSQAIDAQTVDLLTACVDREGGRLQLLTDADELDEAATILAASDRFRYLTPKLHAEMFAEIRFPGDRDPESGIDVRSLELDSSDMEKLDIIRRPDVMFQLANWDAGTALGTDTYDRVRASSALAVVSVPGHELTDYARGGSALESAWIAAAQHGLGVQPISPVFLYAHDRNDLQAVSPNFARSLGHLRRTFRELAGTRTGESQVLVFRLSYSRPTTVRSRRRGLARATCSHS